MPSPGFFDLPSHVLPVQESVALYYQELNEKRTHLQAAQRAYEKAHEIAHDLGQRIAQLIDQLEISEQQISACQDSQEKQEYLIQHNELEQIIEGSTIKLTTCLPRLARLAENIAHIEEDIRLLDIPIYRR